jgi:hypothetical protein
MNEWMEEEKREKKKKRERKKLHISEVSRVLSKLMREREKNVS